MDPDPGSGSKKAGMSLIIHQSLNPKRKMRTTKNTKVHEIQRVEDPSRFTLWMDAGIRHNPLTFRVFSCVSWFLFRNLG
jgi:3'-phosphoadenosine 5'-phosphosulfate sulfotransferase (PAPS reductase)/FAD synthetase